MPRYLHSHCIPLERDSCGAIEEYIAIPGHFQVPVTILILRAPCALIQLFDILAEHTFEANTRVFPVDHHCILPRLATAGEAHVSPLHVQSASLRRHSYLRSRIVDLLDP